METMLLEDLKLDEVENCRISYQRERNQVISLQLTGYIDSYNTHKFRAEIMKVVSLGFVKLLFDLSQVSYISSMGVGDLVGIHKKVRECRGNIALLNPQRKVEEIFDLLGFATFLNVMHATKEEVLDSLFANATLPQKSFPYVFKCPICDKRLLVKRPGVFRCPECRTVLGITDGFEVRLR